MSSQDKSPRRKRREFRSRRDRGTQERDDERVQALISGYSTAKKTSVSKDVDGLDNIDEFFGDIETESKVKSRKLSDFLARLSYAESEAGTPASHFSEFDRAAARASAASKPSIGGRSSVMSEYPQSDRSSVASSRISVDFSSLPAPPAPPKSARESTVSQSLPTPPEPPKSTRESTISQFLDSPSDNRSARESVESSETEGGESEFFSPPPEPPKREKKSNNNEKATETKYSARDSTKSTGKQVPLPKFTRSSEASELEVPEHSPPKQPDTKSQSESEKVESSVRIYRSLTSNKTKDKTPAEPAEIKKPATAKPPPLPMFGEEEEGDSEGNHSPSDGDHSEIIGNNSESDETNKSSKGKKKSPISKVSESESESEEEKSPFPNLNFKRKQSVVKPGPKKFSKAHEAESLAQKKSSAKKKSAKDESNEESTESESSGSEDTAWKSKSQPEKPKKAIANRTPLSQVNQPKNLARRSGGKPKNAEKEAEVKKPVKKQTAVKPKPKPKPAPKKSTTQKKKPPKKQPKKLSAPKKSIVEDSDEEDKRDYVDEDRTDKIQIYSDEEEENVSMDEQLASDNEEEDDEGKDLGEIRLSDLQNLKVEHLKQILKHYELPTVGRKAEMILRIKEFFTDKKNGKKRKDSIYLMNATPTPKKKKKPSRYKVDQEFSEEEEEEEGAESSSQAATGRSKRITRIKPLKFWENERIEYAKKHRPSGDFATVVNIIRNNEDKDTLQPPSKRRKYEDEPFPTALVYSASHEKNINYHVVKNPSMLKWNAFTPKPENQDSSDLTCASNEGEYVGEPVHHSLAFNVTAFASGQIDIAPKSETTSQKTQNSHEFFYIIAGTAEITINDETFILKRGCHFYVPPRNNYSIKNTTNAHLSVLFFRGTEFYEEDEEG